MKSKLTGLSLAAAIGAMSLGSAAFAQDWSDDFESYTDGQVLYNVGGWTGWDDTQSVCGSCSTTYAHGGTKSILSEGADDAVHPFTGLTSGAGTFTAWVYIPVGQFVSDTYFIVQNEYAHGGPYQWCVELQFDFEGDAGGGPGTVADDFRTETNFPPIAFDQWAEIRCELDVDNDTITTYYNNVEVSTGQLFIRGGAVEIANVDLYTLGTSTYYDDMSLTGLGQGGGGYTCTVTGTCPGSINVAWDGAQPNKQQGIVFASNTGSFVVPNGPCQGTQLGLGTQNLRLVNTISTGSGTGSVNGNANSGACGGYLQLVTIGTPCEASTVGQIP